MSAGDFAFKDSIGLKVCALFKNEYIPSKVLTFSKSGKYVFTFDTVCGEVSGVTVRTMLIMFSIFCGSEINPAVRFFVVPDSLETMSGIWPFPKIYFEANKYNNI